LIGIATAATVIALAACSTPPSDDAPSTFRIAVESIDVNFDPYNYGGSLTFPGPAMALFDGLVAWDRSSTTFEPWLAEEYEVSDDGLTLTMKLREDVVFVDGEHMDAAGVEAYLDAALEVETSTVHGGLQNFDPVVNLVDEYTIEIVTNRPMRYFFFLLFQEIPIFSPAVASDRDGPFEKPLGSGPYLIDEIVPDVSATFVRNPDYWNPEAYPFDVIEFHVFADPVAALNALTSGQIDATAIPVSLAAEAEKQGFTINEGGGQFPTLYFFDRDGAIVPALGDVRVRQAINMAFDREAIAEALDLGYGEVSSQPFVPGEPFYIEGADDFYTYDPERARELLAEAGYPDGFDLPILSGGSSANTFNGTAAIEPIIQQSLGDIGIRVTFDQFPEIGAWADEVLSGRHAALAVAHYIGHPFLFQEPGGFFLAGGDPDPAIAAMIEKIEFGTEDEYVEASQEFGRYLIEQAWYAPFSRPPALWATIPGVEVEVGRLQGTPALKEFQLVE
jgi:peptide/nickel transport system substrate-binding protein